ncbi:hypothetical protein D9615_005530 [Tricholomella constricta]|uniref:Uncharacterized protein n=1 Tax=Tricholomella constricta TaxID=117010 RepID=A0A8H5HEE1_9AGAR|nr:hypothetical protein D9615_005530 [Tricholomella constricta]
MAPTRTMGVASNPGPSTFPIVPRPRARSTHRPSNRISAPRSSTSAKVQAYEFVVCIHPEPIYGTLDPDAEDERFKQLRAPTPQKMLWFIERAKTIGLAYDLDLHGLPTDPVLQNLNQSLLTHFNNRHLAFSVTMSPHPSPSSTNTSDTWIQWGLLSAGKTNRSSTSGTLLWLYPHSLALLTQKELQKQTSRWPSYSVVSDPSVPNPLNRRETERQVIFIVPMQSTIIGPLNGTGSHMCLARRMWNRSYTPQINEPSSNPMCDERCDQPETNESIDLQMTEAPNSSPLFTIDPQLQNLAAPASAPATASTTMPSASLPAMPSTALAPQDDLDTLEIWSDEVAALFLTELDYDEELCIYAETTDEAAHAFFSNIISCIGCRPPPLNLARTLSIQNFNIATLFGSRLRVSLGEGVGNGPARSTWAALLRLVVNNSTHWTRISDDLYTPLLVPGLVPSAGDILAFTAYGMIMRLTLLHRHPITPISPFLLLHLIHKFNGTTDEDLIRKTVPNIANRLATWPPRTITDDSGNSTLSLPQGQDPMSLIYELIPNVTASYIRSLTSSSLDAIKRQLTSGLIFGTTDWASIHQNPLFVALKSGFDDQFVEGSPAHASSEALSFIKSFGEYEQTLRIVNSLYLGRVVVHPDQVIQLIRVSNTNLEGNEAQNHLEALCLQSIARYLRGRGYPTGEGSEDRDPPSNHPAFRAREFLKAVTGSEYLTGNFQQILINFVNTFDSSQRLATASGSHLHVCSQTLDILLNEDTKSLLKAEYADAPMDASTPFNLWLSAIVDNSTDSYNNA